jgi:hypothetical protein
MGKSIYIENGFKDRAEYLESISWNYNVPIATVLGAADILGEDEDFDALVTYLQDMEGMF